MNEERLNNVLGPSGSLTSRKFLQSPNKTAGRINVQNLREADVEHSVYMGRDATTLIEAEWR
jgi:hypothetical protein